MTVTLEARGLTKNCDGVAIVDDVDLVAEAGRITVIIGPNGAGKTTLFNCISGTDRPERGTVWHRGDDVTGAPPDALARRGLVRTFQQSSVFPTMTVAENLLTAAENHRRASTMRGLLGLPDPGARRAFALVQRTLGDLGLSALADVRSAVLSSGTLRLVELARALCCEPDTLLLDEPASGLDDGETDALHALLRRLAARQLALVMIEHDLALVHDAADVVYVLASGRVVTSGAPSDVLSRNDVRSLLVGRAP